jgi:predicted dehydrogenase
VFVEKPITSSVSEAAKVIAHAKSANLVLMVGHNTRRRPMFRKAKSILSGKILGAIAGVEMNMSRPVGAQEGLPEWKKDARTAMLVPMTQLGIHFIDTLHYLLGPVARVGCVATNVAMPGGGFDSASAVLELESGVPATLSAYYVTPDIYAFRVHGTKGILHCSSTGYRLDVVNGDRLRKEAAEDFPGEGFASYHEEMNEFGECILKGSRPETGGEEGLRALAVIEAMIRSIRDRRVVDLKEVLQA